jgi:hypothetical protein
MARYKTLLVPHRVVAAGKKRKCFHSAEHQVLKGDIVLEIKEVRQWKGYCLPCAKEIMRQAYEQLRVAETGL